MSQKQYVQAGICEKYQTLLEECGRALAAWDEFRAKVVQSGPAGKEEGNEIFRLQAKYARAYAMLNNHSRDCMLCRLIAGFESSQSPDASTLYGASHH